jgi:hypothetical protein
MISDVVDSLPAGLQRGRWSDESLCGISQKDGFACAFIGRRRHRHPSVGMKQAWAIRPTHHARKENENGKRNGSGEHPAH